MNSSETEKRVATGVYIRTGKSGSQSIRIEFCYRYRSCRETLKLEPTANNIRKAIELRKRILASITLRNFNYAEFFPNSKNAVIFGHATKPILIGELLDQFLERKKERVQSSTFRRYQLVCESHLRKKFGKLPIHELNSAMIYDWLKSFKCQRKTVINILTPFRAIVMEALIYGLLKEDPFEDIVVAKLDKLATNYRVNPFNPQEIQKLLFVAEGQIKNIFQFAFFTGLRTSELIGVRWEDVNWQEGTIYVSRAVVNGKEKCTKTKSSVRNVYLVPFPAGSEGK